MYQVVYRQCSFLQRNQKQLMWKFKEARFFCDVLLDQLYGWERSLISFQAQTAHPLFIKRHLPLIHFLDYHGCNNNLNKAEKMKIFILKPVYSHSLSTHRNLFMLGQYATLRQNCLYGYSYLGIKLSWFELVGFTFRIKVPYSEKKIHHKWFTIIQLKALLFQNKIIHTWN